MVVTENKRNVIHEDEAETIEGSHGERFAGKGILLGATAGSKNLGCTLYEVPPDRSPVPYHYHTANEEAIYVLEGTGILRTESGNTEISKGDYIALPVGVDGAHQIINSSDEPLRYLCVSTMREPEVMVYPDSDKIGIRAGAAPGESREKMTLSKNLRADAEVDYWDGE